jgi:predicted DNA-binding transcriptional regulator AlpA
MSKLCDERSADFTERCRNGRSRQWAKIREIIDALRFAGFETLDEQAQALGLSRSTTWSITRGLHKNSGLSTTTIYKVLCHKPLPVAVRQKLVEYIEEKARGLYGDSLMRVEQFKERLTRLNSRSHSPNQISGLIPRCGIKNLPPYVVQNKKSSA